MIAFMGFWFLLGFVCFTIGQAFLKPLGTLRVFENFEDFFILSLWTGLLICSIVFLAFSLFVPLHPIYFGLLIVFSVAALGREKPRFRFPQLKFYGISFAVVSVLIAYYEVQNILWNDTGLYHYPLIKWLSQYGSVTGLALIHNRFGFSSSWLALAAPFNFGIFEGRLVSLTGGFALLLAFGHFLLSIHRIADKRAGYGDWYIFSALGVAVPILGYSPNKILVSPSPDIPIIFLCVVLPWCMILLFNQKTFFEQKEETIIDARLIPLILSAGAMSIKPTSVPLLVISFVFFCFGPPQKIY